MREDQRGIPGGHLQALAQQERPGHLALKVMPYCSGIESLTLPPMAS